MNEAVHMVGCMRPSERIENCQEYCLGKVYNHEHFSADNICITVYNTIQVICFLINSVAYYKYIYIYN